ncbi:hypothetical protein CA54_43190 [Symmachiella macrocystis]|uniref:Uncharacterized protein n=1 Tax=Symmachiella macrocystis TaxID=2527985 RepID=A0A5C6BCS0_9PLAN|nr:hypothetical protein CA54_43190 [Symmachiella macrocystis]
MDERVRAQSAIRDSSKQTRFGIRRRAITGQLSRMVGISHRPTRPTTDRDTTQQRIATNRHYTPNESRTPCERFACHGSSANLAPDKR